MNKKRISILGAGAIAQFHIESLRRAGFDVVSAASSKNSRSIRGFCEKNNIEEYYADPQDLLSSQDWDALLIATPVSCAADYARQVASDGRPALIEKPVALSSESLNDLRHAKNIVVAFNRRNYSTSLYAREYLKKNPGNSVLKVSVPETSVMPHDVAVDGLTFPYYVYENSVHVFDLIRFLSGDISWKHSIRNVHAKLACSSVSASGLTSSGDALLLDMVFDAPQNFSIDIVSSSDCLSLKPIEVLVHYSGMDICEPSEEMPIRLYKPNIFSKVIEETDDGMKPGFLRQAQEFYNFVCSGDKGNLATLDDAYVAMCSIETLGNL